MDKNCLVIMTARLSTTPVVGTRWQMHSRKSRSRLNALHACHIPFLTELRSTGVNLEVKDREEALASFQVRPIFIDRVLEAPMMMQNLRN